MASIRQHLAQRLITEIKSRACWVEECGRPLYNSTVGVAFDGGMHQGLPRQVTMTVVCGWCGADKDKTIQIDDAMRRDVAASYREDGPPIDDDEMAHVRVALADWRGDFKSAVKD